MNDSWVADPAMDCQVTLKPFIGDYDELKSIVLLGDSVMRLLFHTIHENPSCKLLRGGATGTAAGRCELLEYMGLEKGIWVPPRLGLEGPHPKLFGGQNPFCSDLGCSYRVCDQHYAQSWHCPTSSPESTPCASPPCTGGRVVEYLPVEFARDVEQPSRNTTTTQESVALYLQQDPRDLCVLNAGIHDMQCTAEPAPAHPWRNHTVIDDDKTYVNNVAKYIELIEPGCKRMIWLHTTAICGVPKHCQRNTRILLWNQLVEAMLQDRFPDVAVVDTFPVTTSLSQHQCFCDKHKGSTWNGDQVHLQEIYSNLVRSWILGPSM